METKLREMELDDSKKAVCVFEKALGYIEELLSNIKADPALREVLDEGYLERTRKQLIRKIRKVVFDERLMKDLVLLIEIIGMSGKQAFQKSATKAFSAAKIKKLWFDTKNSNPGKIEEFRQHLAYRYVYVSIECWEGNRIDEIPRSILNVLSRLHDREPELFYWAMKKVRLDSRGIEYEDFEPDYKKVEEALEIDLLSFGKQIALEMDSKPQM